MKNTSRRDFLLYGLGLGLFTSLGIKEWAHAEKRRGSAKPDAAGGLKLCSPDEPALKNIRYFADHSQVKAASDKIARGGVEFNKQFCNSCMFYVGKPEDKVAKCQLAAQANCGVAAKGWCASWAKKA